jgi:O-antigen ligase
MIQVIHYALALVFLYWIFKSITDPSITWILGIVGAVVISATMTFLLDLTSVVTLTWLILIIISSVSVWRIYRVPFFEGTWGEWAILGFSLALLYSRTYTPTYIYGEHKMLLFLASCVPLYFFSRMVGRNMDSVRRMLSISVFPCFIITIAFGASLVLQGRAIDGDRFGGGMSIMYGIWIATCVGVFVHSFYGNNYLHKWVSALGILSVLVVIPSTGSRIAFFSLFIATFLAFFSFRAVFKSILVTIVVVALSVALMGLLAPGKLDDRLKNVSLAAMAESGRTGYYILSLEIFAEHPIRGSGVGGFSYLEGHDAKMRGLTWTPAYRLYPHNLWLETACEQGLLGLLPLLVLTYLGFRHLRWLRKCVDPSIAVPLQIIFWISFFQAMTTSDLPMYRGIFASWGLLSGFHRCYREQEMSALAEMPSYDPTPVGYGEPLPHMSAETIG